MASKPRNVPLTPDEIEALVLMEGDMSEIEDLDDEDLDNEVDRLMKSCDGADRNLLGAATNGLSVNQDKIMNFEFLNTENTDLDNVSLSDRLEMNNDIESTSFPKEKSIVHVAKWRHNDIVSLKCNIEFSQPAEDLVTPQKYFRYFIDNEMIRNIVNQTNLYSVQKMDHL